MPISENKEMGVKPLTWQSSLNIAGVPIKKRRFIRPPSPPLEEQSAPPVENDTIPKQHGSTIRELATSDASPASFDSSDPDMKSVPEENKKSSDSILQTDTDNSLQVKIEGPNLTIQSDSLARFGKEGKLAVADKSSYMVLNSGKTELNTESREAPGLDVDKQIISQQLLEGKCESERAIASGTSQLSLGLKQYSSLKSYSNGGCQNLENVAAVSLNLSLSKVESGTQSKMDRVHATGSTDVCANRSNWDLNTTMDAWDGSAIDKPAGQITADRLNRDSVTPNVTAGIVGDGASTQRQLLRETDCKSSFTPTFSEHAEEYNSEDPLNLRLSPSFLSFNLSQEPSNASANKECRFVPNISLPGGLSSAGIATSVSSRAVKSEPFDGILKHDHRCAKVNPTVSPDFLSVKLELVEKSSLEDLNSGKCGALKLADPGFIKPEPFHDGKPETPSAVEGTSIQHDKQVLQCQDCPANKQMLLGQDGKRQSSCSTGDQVREGEDTLAKPACSTDLSINGNTSYHLEHATCAEGSHDRKEVAKEACETDGQVSSEMVPLSVGHNSDDLDVSVKTGTAITEDRNVDNPEQCKLNFIDEVPAGSHGNGEASASDEEKVNLSGDMLEEDSYGSIYESDGANESDGHSLSMDIEEECREQEYEDGEVRDPNLQAAAEGEKCEKKDVNHGNSEHETTISAELVDDHYGSSHAEEGDSKLEDLQNSKDIVKECIITPHGRRMNEDANNTEVKEPSSVELPTTVADEERAIATTQGIPFESAGKKDDSVDQEAVLSSEQDNCQGQGPSVSVEQGSDENIKTNNLEKNEFPKVEASLNEGDMAKDINSGGNRSRIINLSRASNSSSPGKTRSISGRPLPSYRERLPDVPLEGAKLHPRGRDEIYNDVPHRFSRERHDQFPRSSRMNFVRGRGRISGRIDALRGDRDSERNYASEFYNGSSDFAVRRHKYASAVTEANSEYINYNIGPDGAFVGTVRGGRKLLDDETPVFHHLSSRRRSPGRDGPAARGIRMVRRVPRNIDEDGSEVVGVRHAENMRGFPDDGTEQAFARPQPSFEGLDGHFVSGTRNYSRRAFPHMRPKSPSRSRSPGPWSSTRRRSPDGFGGPSELPNRRSPVYRVDRIRSPDHPGYSREMVVRRHGSPPFLSRPNDMREMDPGGNHGLPRSMISNRGQAGRVLLRNSRRFGITDPRHRTDGDEFFGGPMHSGRFHELSSDGNVEDRRRFNERRGPVHSFKPPFSGADGENFHLNPEDSGSRPLRFFQEGDPEFHERANLREREFDGRIKTRPGNGPRRPQEGNYRHGGQGLYDDGFDDISRVKRKRF